jgi:hypothetical protein
MWQKYNKTSYLFKAINLNPTILGELEVRQEIAKWENDIFHGNKRDRKTSIKNIRKLIKLLEELEADEENHDLVKAFLREHISPATLFILKRNKRGNIPTDFFNPKDSVKLGIWKSISHYTELLLRRHYDDQQQKVQDIEILLYRCGLDEKDPNRKFLISKCLPLERNDIARFITAHLCGISLSTFDHKHLDRLNKLYKNLTKQS